MKIRWGKISKRKKNLEKVIQQCQKTLDKIDEELAKPEPKLTPYDIEMGNFDEVPRGILKGCIINGVDRRNFYQCHFLIKKS